MIQISRDMIGGVFFATSLLVGGLALAADKPIASPSTAYLYDWQLLPIGQLMWMKELATYREFPPLQVPEAYNLDEIEKQMAASGAKGMGQ